jgi:hypothetical protein
MVQRWQRGYPAGAGIWLEALGRVAGQCVVAARRAWSGARRAEQVELMARRFAYQPLRFRWHGSQHRVQRIERVWERGLRGAPRRYFRVRCGDDQSYTLFQDLRLGAWYVEVI